MNERRFRIVTANIIIAAMLSVVLSAALLAVLPESGEEVPAGKAVYSGDPAGGKVSLMVNVYENTPAVEEIARLLAERGMSTTFFIGGKWAEKNGDALLKLAADGFELGNHGYLHRDHATLSYDANRAEILVTERLLKATLEGLGEAASSAVAPLFAPPSGSLGGAMFDAADALGYTVVMWTRDTVDWRDHDPDIIARRAVDRPHPHAPDRRHRRRPPPHPRRRHRRRPDRRPRLPSDRKQSGVTHRKECIWVRTHSFEAFLDTTGAFLGCPYIRTTIFSKTESRTCSRYSLIRGGIRPDGRFFGVSLYPYYNFFEDGITRLFPLLPYSGWS